MGEDHIFDAWYTGDLTNAYAYYVGDTKSIATARTVSAVPIPAAIWLFAPALAGFTALRRKRTA
ncbi:VPLPA-CTERM sorting domain-containing protein [Pseudomonadota bacterium]|nr:VPLPA-CTERM sorting domain-containing protein [Pseudomonadota bacterium]